MHAHVALSPTAALAVLGFSVAISSAQAATTYTFTTVINPDSISSSEFQFFNDQGLGTATFDGINDNGDIVAFPVNSAGNTIGLLVAPNASSHVSAGSAPEPATRVMILAGFAGLGFFGTRRRRGRRQDMGEE
jgi:hypothetical protein